MGPVRASSAPHGEAPHPDLHELEGSTECAVEHLGLSFRPESNAIRPPTLSLRYSLPATMVIPSEKTDGTLGAPAETLFLRSGEGTVLLRE